MDRYHQMLEAVPDGPPRTELERIGADLATALDGVHQVCLRAQEAAPSDGQDVPGHEWTTVHRSLTQGATQVAQAAQAAALTRVAVAAGDGDATAASLAAARRAADRAIQLVDVAVARGTGQGRRSPGG